MKKYLNKKLIVIAVASVIFIPLAIVVIQRYYLAPSNVRASIEKALSTSQLANLASTPVPTYINCGPSEFESVCKSEIYVNYDPTYPHQDRVSYVAVNKSSQELLSYISSLTKRLKNDNWSAYDAPLTDGISSIGRNFSRSYGATYCEIGVGYQLKDPVSGKSPSYSQYITCGQSIQTFGLF